MVRIGYFLSSEEYGPHELVRQDGDLHAGKVLPELR
jgi:hypothetical protein